MDSKVCVFTSGIFAYPTEIPLGKGKQKAQVHVTEVSDDSSLVGGFRLHDTMEILSPFKARSFEEPPSIEQQRRDQYTVVFGPSADGAGPSGLGAGSANRRRPEGGNNNSRSARFYTPMSKSVADRVSEWEVVWEQSQRTAAWAQDHHTSQSSQNDFQANYSPPSPSSHNSNTWSSMYNRKADQQDQPFGQNTQVKQKNYTGSHNVHSSQFVPASRDDLQDFARTMRQEFQNFMRNSQQTGGHAGPTPTPRRTPGFGGQGAFPVAPTARTGTPKRRSISKMKISVAHSLM